MSVPIYQRTATTGTGDIIPNAEYTVINEGTGTGQTIYSNRAGTSVKSPPYYADGTGLIQFYIAPGVTFRVAATDGVDTYTDRYVYAAYAQETSGDTGTGRLMEVGAFGLGVDFQGDGSGNVDIAGELIVSSASGTLVNLTATDAGTPQNIIKFKDTGGTTAFVGHASSGSDHFYIQNSTAAGDMLLSTAGSERLRIDSTGNVGIGTNSPAKKVEIAGNNQALASNTTLRFTDTDTATQTNQHFGKIEFNSLDASAVSPNRAYITAASENSLAGSYISFGTSAFTAAVSEKLRIDGSGNVIVGKTSTTESTEGIELRADGWLKAIRSSAYAATFRRNDTDGNIVEFLKDSVTVGSIGVVSGGNFYINGGDTGLCFRPGADDIVPVSSGGSGRDNVIDIGDPSFRFDNIYATNGTIQTSDRNEKQDILEITTAETAVAKACKGLLRSFRWKSAVNEKGDDARIHFGIIAQDLQDAFTAEGLDAGRYGMFISSTWWETQTEVEAVEAVEAIEGVEFVAAVEASEAVEAVYSEDGEIISEAIEAVEAVQGVEAVKAVEAVEAKDAYIRTDTFNTLAEAPVGATERTRLGVRYPELLAFIIAAL